MLLVIFELGAFFADIIGTGLFYLSSLRLVQMLCEKHELKHKAGLCFGLAIGLYALSILLGYAIGFAFFDGTPTWLFLIVLTCLTIVAACIAYFTFVFEMNPSVRGGTHNQNNNRDNQNNGAEQGEPEEELQLFRDGLNFGTIFKFTFKTYGKMMPLMGVQMMLGTLFAYGYSLL